MAGDLRKRLERLRKLARAEEDARSLGLSRASELPEPVPLEGPAPASGDRGLGRREGGPEFLKGWDKLGDLVWSRSLRFKDYLGEEIDPLPFNAIGRRRPGQASGLAGPVPTGRLRFFDLETTGLSGGSGTVAFLAAIGSREEGDFVVRQYFLEDYPGEAGFVRELLSALEGRTVVTYNGRSFDLPLLRTRCVMNGLIPPRAEDIDCLFAARRLWKSVHGGASLGLLEREVLGIEREEDVPGSMIPDIWFSYIKAGDSPLMDVVMSHNADDVVALARLLARAALVFEAPLSWLASASLDRAGLGRTLLALGRQEEAEELLEAALGDGHEGAGLVLSRHYRRRGREADRRRVLGMLPESPRSWIERSKFLEHVERDNASALALAELALASAWTRRLEEALRLRVERLRRKLGMT